ncbi:hypothetical protein K438DRAFT_1770301 [Mycena galopus ATCC 62051]|nr:hypothetical protein K438DRAFT_1770301 [Mycena galopus ATCC 62051]
MAMPEMARGKQLKWRTELPKKLPISQYYCLLLLARGGGPFSESPEVQKNLNSVHEERPYGHPPSKIQENLLRQEYYIHDSILAPAKISPPNNISSIETSSYHLKSDDIPPSLRVQYTQGDVETNFPNATGPK